MDDLWNVFLSSGKISDYLNYKKNEKSKNFSSGEQSDNRNVFEGVTSDADNNKRNSNS